MSQLRANAPAARRKLFQRLALAAVAIVLVAAGLWAWSGRKAASSEAAFRTAPVERGDIRVAISATGTLSAISTVTVGSQVSGQVTEILVDFNSQVKQGQVLARIDASTYEAQIQQGNAQVSSARAGLAQAEATLRNAQLDYRRKADLGGQKLVAQSDVDLSRAALDQARAQVNSSKAQIRQQLASTQTTRVNLDRTVIRSPVDGVVLTRKIEPGQTVAASLSAPELFTIAEDLGKMKIELAVDEADIGQIRVGQPVSFTADAFADRRFSGSVEQVRLAASTTSNVVTYPVVVTVDNSDGTLLPGLTVNAEIEVSSRADVLKVSNAALRFKPAQEAAPAAAASAAMRGGGITEDLARMAAELKLNPQQQAAFDAAVAQIRERQAARQAAPQAGGTSMFGGGPGGGARPAGAQASGNVQAQIRKRMLERYKQDFAAFRSGLDAAQARQWDSGVAASIGARRAPIYKLVDGEPQQVMVRIGASDGSSTEISGDIREGDLAISGERSKE